jgi:hypothetical protein
LVALLPALLELDASILIALHDEVGGEVYNLVFTLFEVADQPELLDTFGALQPASDTEVILRFLLLAYFCADGQLVPHADHSVHFALIKFGVFL